MRLTLTLKEGACMKPKQLALAASIAAVFTAPAWAADAAKIDWKRVPTKTVTLFYPAQSSYEWTRSSAHPGAQGVKDGAACTSCHAGQEKAKGDKLVKGGPLEPAPVRGKNGWVDLKVQAAYDDSNAYFRFQWKTNN